MTLGEELMEELIEMQRLYTAARELFLSGMRELEVFDDQPHARRRVLLRAANAAVEKFLDFEQVNIELGDHLGYVPPYLRKNT